MGLIAATVTKQYLMAYKHDIEYKMTLIRQARLELEDSVKDLLNVGNDMDPESPTVKQLEQRKERLNMLEKKLDTELEEYEVKLKMIDANMKASDDMIKESIK